MKYNILFVIDNIEFGGGERVVAQIINKLPMDKYRTIVACMPGGIFQEKINESKVNLEPVDMRNRFNPVVFRRLANLMKREKIDIVHSQGARADFFARVAGKIAGVPHILCTIAMPVEGFDIGPFRKTIYRFMDRLSERYVERFIVVSDSLKRTLIEGRGINAYRVVRIYNGIETDQYNPSSKDTALRTKWGIPTTNPLIGAIGRLVWQKGFEFLIKAIPEIVQVTPNARFLLVGDGPLRPYLEGLAQDLNVYEKVIFTGFRSDIQRLLSTVDILAAPSLLEGFPMITLEAMAMARPIVATKIQGITEQIMDGKEGILVPPQNPGALARALLRLIKDRELGARLGKAARSKIECCFSIDKMVRETEQVYLSLLKAS